MKEKLNYTYTYKSAKLCGSTGYGIEIKSNGYIRKR